LVWHAIQHVRWQDAADIAILTAILWAAYALLRGTVAVRVALAILIVLVGAWFSGRLGLTLTSAVLSALVAIAAIAVVVIFRDEIRLGLGRSTLWGWWSGRASRDHSQHPWWAIGRTMFALAPRRVGALIVIPRRDDVSSHLTGGSIVDSIVSTGLLEAIFTSESPLHDGAVIVREGQIAYAGAVLPLSRAELPDSYGTRHRAAIGVTEICDAIAICVSEESGQVSIGAGGELQEVSDARQLAERLAEACRAAPRRSPSRTVVPDPAAGGRRQRRFLRDAAAYIAILAGVVGAWSAKTLDHSQSVARTVSLEFRGISDSLAFDPPADSTVVVEVRGPKRQLEGLPAGRVTAFVDLSMAVPGRHFFAVAASVPDGMRAVSIMPKTIEIHVHERRSQLELPDIRK